MHLEGHPYPGDVQIENRFAIAGSFRHITGGTNVSGKVVAPLGALVPSLLGTATFVPPMDIDDRYHVEGRPYPGTFLTTEDRFALGFAYRRITGSSSSNGSVAGSLGALRASFVGSALFSIFFDVDYTVTATFAINGLTPSLGAMGPTLGTMAAALRGSVLPPDSVSGLIPATLGRMTASLLGTMTPPAGRSGIVHCDLSGLVVAARGTAVPPNGNVGIVSANLGALSMSSAGTFAPFIANGLVSISLAPLTDAFFGQSLLPGDIYGLLPGQLGSLTAAFSGNRLPPTGVTEIRATATSGATRATASARRIRATGKTRH